jgi:hypothetical protein
MEQWAVIWFLNLQALKAKVIHSEIMPMCEQDTLVLSRVKKWRKRFSEGRRDFFDDRRFGRPLTPDFAEAIHSVLEGRPFTSCKILYRHFRIGEATCLRILRDSLGLKRIHLRWVPHLPYRRTRRANKLLYSGRLLETLEEAEKVVWACDHRR